MIKQSPPFSTNPLDDPQTLARLEREYEAAKQIKADIDDPIPMRSWHEQTSNEPLEIVETFTACVKSGYMPPPKVLIALAKAFDRYLDNDNVSLDLALNLRPVQKGGDPRRKKYRLSGEWGFLYKMAEIRNPYLDNRGKIAATVSIQKAAENVLPSNFDDKEGRIHARLVQQYKARKIDKLWIG